MGDGEGSAVHQYWQNKHKFFDFANMLF